MLVTGAILIGCGNETPEAQEPMVEEGHNVDTNNDDADFNEGEEEGKAKQEETAVNEVSREFKNALRSAENYLSLMNFSKEGLFEQLIFENYPEDAANYAVESVNTDWYENALGSALTYLELISFSDQGLYDQLIFEGYTSKEAQFALDNLPE